MKQECSTYLKTTRKSKGLAATLSDPEPEDDFNNENDRILNAFIATIILLKGLLKMWMKKKTLWSLKFIRWMNKMTST